MCFFFFFQIVIKILNVQNGFPQLGGAGVVDNSMWTQVYIGRRIPYYPSIICAFLVDEASACVYLLYSFDAP